MHSKKGKQRRKQKRHEGQARSNDHETCDHCTSDIPNETHETNETNDRRDNNSLFSCCFTSGFPEGCFPFPLLVSFWFSIAFRYGSPRVSLFVVYVVFPFVFLLLSCCFASLGFALLCCSFLFSLRSFWVTRGLIPFCSFCASFFVCLCCFCFALHSFA